VEQMQSATRSTIGLPVLVLQELRATLMSGVSNLNVWPTQTAPSAGHVSITTVWMYAACLMCVARIPNVKRPIMCQDVSAKLALLEIQLKAVPKCSYVQLRSSVPLVCSAALVSVPRLVNPPESVWTTRSV
jgi:hypothetical protein